MRGYELTERGKIIIAVLLVLILLVIPSTVIALKTVAAYIPFGNTAHVPDTEAPATPPHTDIEIQSPAYTEPPATQRPEQNAEASPPVSEATPPESDDAPPLPEATPPQTETVPPGDTIPAPAVTEPTTPVPESFVDGDKLSFIFSPSNQTELDKTTETLLRDFLEIPESLPDCVIVAETRDIPDADAEALLKAIAKALEKRGVSSNQLEHISFPPSSEDSNIEVKLYFVSKWIK